MPAEGVSFRPSEQILTDEEIIRLMRIGVGQCGIEEIRFTGGEPLMRRSLEELVAAASQLRSWKGKPLDLSLTTNGLGLKHRAKALAEAGLTRVNISMDSATREGYRKLTRRDRFQDAAAGARAAVEAGLTPVKLNALLMPGVNEDEAPELVRYALKGGYELRFIEFMPLGPRGSWKREQMVTRDDILDKLRPHFDLAHRPERERGPAPAEEWDVMPGANHPGGRIGIIGSVTRPFCGDCDRTRLTADGQIRSCLFARNETDLRSLLRGGATDQEIARVWRLAMWGKQPGHGINDPSFLSPSRPMSAIGG
ncbi:molybdenum cofactor biosynthesis protein A [Winkia neuii]|nr:molybdenum cofactor biosynthesis protein A [Winkia neuii]